MRIYSNKSWYALITFYDRPRSDVTDYVTYAFAVIGLIAFDSDVVDSDVIDSDIIDIIDSNVGDSDVVDSDVVDSVVVDSDVVQVLLLIVMLESVNSIKTANEGHDHMNPKNMWHQWSLGLGLGYLTHVQTDFQQTFLEWSRNHF